MRVKCLTQEHNAMAPALARARNQTARSGVERTNHEATAPPTDNLESINYISTCFGSFRDKRHFGEPASLKKSFHANLMSACFLS